MNWGHEEKNRLKRLRESLEIARKSLENGRLGLRARNQIQATIITQEDQVKELLWQRRFVREQRKTEADPMYIP
jgi:hypothetical protein